MRQILAYSLVGLLVMVLLSLGVPTGAQEATIVSPTPGPPVHVEQVHMEDDDADIVTFDLRGKSLLVIHNGAVVVDRIGDNPRTWTLDMLGPMLGNRSLDEDGNQIIMREVLYGRTFRVFVDGVNVYSRLSDPPTATPTATVTPTPTVTPTATPTEKDRKKSTKEPTPHR